MPAKPDRLSRPTPVPINESNERSLYGESLVRMSDVPRLLPPKSDGRLVGVSTVYRWALKGAKGVRLETARVPWGRVTSVEAVRRFIDRLNAGERKEQQIRETRPAAQADDYIRSVLKITAKGGKNDLA